MEARIKIPEYEIKSVIDVLILANEDSMSDIELGMRAGREGYDKHVRVEYQPIDFISDLRTWNLFFKKSQLKEIGFSREEINDPTRFDFTFFHDNSDYYFDPYEDNPEHWNEDEYYMIRKSKNEIYLQ